jgi:hypothetical protein
MAMKKSPGPARPADLLRKPANPVQKSASAKGKSTSTAPASSADDGECTCGAEVGKQLEALGAGTPPAKPADKGPGKEYEDRPKG